MYHSLILNLNLTFQEFFGKCFAGVIAGEYNTATLSITNTSIFPPKGERRVELGE